MDLEFVVKPIGYVIGGRADPTDDFWGSVRAKIEIDTTWIGPDALCGLAEFSHIEVVFVFNQVAIETVECGARRPRGRQDWPQVGIFAQRGKNRPNRLGVSVCRILRVDGPIVHVEGLDAIHGTPILDIKPVMLGFMPQEAIIQPDWATEIMQSYWR